jgi:hypothetical protein
MKQSRENAFAQFRNVTIEKRVSKIAPLHCSATNFTSLQNAILQQLIDTIVKEELAINQIESDIELHENILKEIFDNWEQWQKEEYEREFMSLDPDSQTVFCPVCQTNLLTLQENIISCNCGLRLYYPKSLQEFFDRILVNVKIHEERCLEKLTFFTEPKVGFKVLGLNAYCTVCDYYASVVELI